jgi:hypothetical protein
VAVGPDDLEAVLSVVPELNEAHGVNLGVIDVGGFNPVLQN